MWAAGLAEQVDALGSWRGWPSIAAELGEPSPRWPGGRRRSSPGGDPPLLRGCGAELADVPGERPPLPVLRAVRAHAALPAVLVAFGRPHPAAAPTSCCWSGIVRADRLWALVAGFVEAGESLEDAAHREVGEEVGLALREVAYFGSQPWAMSGPGVLLAGFLPAARPHAEPVVDGRELAQARWFPLDALPAELPPAYSISRWLIDAAAGVQNGAGRSS